MSYAVEQYLRLSPDDMRFELTVETASIKSVSKSIAKDMVAMYHGNEPGQTPGLLPEPYYCTKSTKFFLIFLFLT